MPTWIDLAPGVRRLPLLPFDALNVYLLDDVVVDAGTRRSRGTLLAALAGHELRAHVLTHAHPDHQGASAALCTERDVPFWCGAHDRQAAERGSFDRPWRGHKRRRLFRWAEPIAGPGHPVDRALHEGDAIGDFVVIETPGHTPGHISLWRERDGIAIIGDVASHRNVLSLSFGLREPSPAFTVDPVANRRSIRAIAALRPSVVAFGHGPPLVDGSRFVRWARRLPCDGGA